MSLPPLFSLRQVRLSFGGKPLFSDLTCHIHVGDRICLVGRNGTGKSTLLKMIGGIIDFDQGDYFLQPGKRIAYLPQDLLLPKMKIADYISKQTNAPLYEIDSLLTDLKIPAERMMEDLSGGECRRIALACALVQKPDILLLDEPTNHLDIQTIEWMEEKLRSFSGAYVVISHDRTFLERVSQKTFWIDRGILRQNNKGYQDFERWSDFLLQEEENQIAKQTTKLRQETEWLHRGVTARRKRNQGRLRQLHRLRQEKRLHSHQPKELKIGSMETELSSKMVIEVKDISKKFGDHVILDHFNTRILRGDRIGILGANGTGKSTFLKLLLGILPPDEGRIRLGKTVQTTYFDQMRDSLKPEETLWETLCETGGDQVIVQGKHRHVMGYLKDFLFDEKQVRGPVSILSGGEKNRLALAKSLAQPGNLLILDEPTNDLDMDTLDLLLDTLYDYTGTLIVVSHDRDFLDKLTTSLIVFEGDGQVDEYIGGYTDYLAQRKGKEPEKIDRSDSFKKKPDLSHKPSRKISYHEKRDHEKLPCDIEELQNKIHSMEKQLENGDFYQNHPEEFLNMTHQLELTRQDLDQKETYWLKLDEKINGAPEQLFE